MLKDQRGVILALPILQPDVGHEVLWVVRDCLSGAVLLARCLLSGRAAELAPLLREVAEAVGVPVLGVAATGRPRCAGPWPRPCRAGGAAPALPVDRKG